MMRTREAIITHLTDPGIIPVVRTQSVEQLPPLCEALLAGGLRALELTLTIPGVLGVLPSIVSRFSDRAVVGVGSVLNTTQASAALAAGAEFLVSPICRPELVSVAHAAGKPVFLGAYTPTEAQTVHESGADMVKLFPADKLGPGHIKALRAPMPHLRIVPTGGVDLNTATDFLKAGCAALGVGSSLITAEILKTENWAELTRLARAYTDLVRAYRAKK